MTFLANLAQDGVVFYKFADVYDGSQRIIVCLWNTNTSCVLRGILIFMRIRICRYIMPVQTTPTQNTLIYISLAHLTQGVCKRKNQWSRSSKRRTTLLLKKHMSLQAPPLQLHVRPAARRPPIQRTPTEALPLWQKKYPLSSRVYFIMDRDRQNHRCRTRQCSICSLQLYQRLGFHRRAPSRSPKQIPLNDLC